MTEFVGILITLLIGVAIFTLLALVSRRGGGCCGNAHGQKGEGKSPSCCNNHKT